MPARLVMAPEVPIRWARFSSKTGRMGSAWRKAARSSFTRSTMARNQASVASAPSGNCSARVTTPMGMESQALMGSFEATKVLSSPPRPSPVRSTQESSVEPPPTSTTRAASAVRSSRFRQPATESWASSRGAMICRRRPVSSKTRSTNSGPFCAMRQAWVAMALSLTTRRRRTFSALTLRAAMARSMAASDSRPLWDSPSPSRTMRE